MEEWSGRKHSPADEGTGCEARRFPVTPLLMALHDATGITHELTGWTNDVLAMAKIFGDERALEFCTQNLINGVKEIVNKSSEQNVEAQLSVLPRKHLSLLLQWIILITCMSRMRNLKEQIRRIY